MCLGDLIRKVDILLHPRATSVVAVEGNGQVCSDSI